MNENSYALKSPVELLDMFARLHGVDRTGAKYICSYIEGILKNKGYTVKIEDKTYSLEPIKPPFIFSSLKNAMLYHKATGNDDWIVMDATSELAKGREMHESIFGEYKYNKENVKPNKEKEMKNIFIKFENKHLVNYVYNKLKRELLKENSNAYVNVESSCPFYAIRIIGKEMTVKKCVAAVIPSDAKLFVVTAAANADTIIEEVIKEYNKVEHKSFLLGGTFTGHTIPVVVYKDMVSFNNEYMSFDNFCNLQIHATKEVGGFRIGGTDIVLFTHGNGTKVYVQRDEFTPIIDAILERA